MMIQLSRGCVNSEPEEQEIKHEEDNGREEEADIRIMKENEQIMRMVMKEKTRCTLAK